jgi:hypothetical protein
MCVFSLSFALDANIQLLNEIYNILFFFLISFLFHLISNVEKISRMLLRLRFLKRWIGYKNNNLLLYAQNWYEMKCFIFPIKWIYIATNRKLKIIIMMIFLHYCDFIWSFAKIKKDKLKQLHILFKKKIDHWCHNQELEQLATKMKVKL